MKRVVEFEVDTDKYQYVNQVAQELGLYDRILHVMLIPPHKRDSKSKYYKLPYIGNGISVNKDLGIGVREWRVSNDEADIIKKRFAGLDKTTQKLLVDMASVRYNEWLNNNTQYRRDCLCPYVGHTLMFVGTLSNLRTVTLNKDTTYAKKAVKAYIKNITSPDSSNIKLDHVVITVYSDEYPEFKNAIGANVDDVFRGGIRIQFEAQVGRYATDRRYGLKHISNIDVLGGGE